MRTSRIGTGAVGVVALRAILAGKNVELALKPHIAGKSAHAMLRRMVEDGLIVRVDGRFSITKKGEAELSGDVRPDNFRQYTPPPPPTRRPGSDCSHIPSRVADELVPHWSKPRR